MKDWFTSRESWTERYPMLYGIVIGVLVMGLAWLVLPGLLGSGSPGNATEGALTGAHATVTVQPEPQSTSSPKTRPDSSEQRLSRCRQVYAAQRQPLRAAAAAMAQWQVHIAAMNKLVLGVITLKQANQFWNQTRVGAHTRLREFDTAQARLNRETIRCPHRPLTRPAHNRLTRCEQAVSANFRALRLARKALMTWRMHVHHMEMLRTGMMSPSRATQLWLMNWHQGQDEVARYRGAVRAARAHHC